MQNLKVIRVILDERVKGNISCAREFLPSRVEPYQKDVIFHCFYTIENTTFAVSIDGVNLIPASDKIFIDVTTFRKPMRKKLDKCFRKPCEFLMKPPTKCEKNFALSPSR